MAWRQFFRLAIPLKVNYGVLLHYTGGLLGTGGIPSTSISAAREVASWRLSLWRCRNIMQSSVYVETATPRTKDRGADLFVALLRAQGVQQVMALTGGAIMEGMDALQAAEHLDMRIFQTEPGAAWAAMGYARATGQVGVCVVTSGPGATNTITAIADAHRDNVPLVIITGQVPTSARNTDAFQETNIVEIAAPTAKKVFYLNRLEDMAAVVSEAFHIATQGRPGPVLIDLTKDAQQARVHPNAFPVAVPQISASSSTHSKNLSEAALNDVVTLLRQAERPVIIAGYGVLLANARRELQQFLQVVPCPVVHTLPGKAALPTAHPYNYGMLGMHGFYISNWIVHHADLVVSLGSRYDDRITGDPQRFAPQAKRLIHFDRNASWGWWRTSKPLSRRCSVGSSAPHLTSHAGVGPLRRSRSSILPPTRAVRSGCKRNMP